MNGMPVTEAEFTNSVIALAQLRGWKVAHFRPARTIRGWRTAVQGDIGFPDLVLARNGVVIFAELKTDKGKIRPEQEEWHQQIGTVYVWRPGDIRTEILDVLR